LDFLRDETKNSQNELSNNIDFTQDRTSQLFHQTNDEMYNQKQRTFNLENQVQNNSQNIDILGQEMSNLKKIGESQEAINQEMETGMKKANEKTDQRQMINTVVTTVQDIVSEVNIKIINNEAKMNEDYKINQEQFKE